jgi:hypothetical protein
MSSQGTLWTGVPALRLVVPPNLLGACGEVDELSRCGPPKHVAEDTILGEDRARMGGRVRWQS